MCSGKLYRGCKFLCKLYFRKKKFKKEKAEKIDGFYLKETLSFDEVVVQKIIENEVRPKFICKVVKSVLKKGMGAQSCKGIINRSLYSCFRVGMLSTKKILNELEYLSVGVEKTAGPKEKKAWTEIKSYIVKNLNAKK